MHFNYFKNSPGKKNMTDEPTAFLKPVRAASAQRHNTLPTFQVRYSATHRRPSHHSYQDVNIN